MRRLIGGLAVVALSLAAPAEVRADNAQAGAVIGVAVSLSGFSTLSR